MRRLSPSILFWLLLSLVGAYAGFGRPSGIELPHCLMEPPFQEIALPARGFNWLKNEEQVGACSGGPAKNWEQGHKGPLELFVHADGPSGSGRYWTVTVGVAAKGRSRPERGACFTTGTVGWRTLHQFKDGPLPWLQDLDHDGNAELIVWDSFPLHKEPSMAEYGLMAWVYKLTPERTLALDWKLSRQSAESIATSYRHPLEVENPSLTETRREAAEALEEFTQAMCVEPTTIRTSHPAYQP